MRTTTSESTVGSCGQPGVMAWALVTGTCVISLVGTAALAAAGAAPAAASGPIRFEAHRVGTFRSEACGVGDFNNDGKLDIIAGDYLYVAPAFHGRRIRALQGEVDQEGNGYIWDFMDAPLDVDGDGLLDVVSCSWHGKQMEWYRNLGSSDDLWPVTVVHKNGNYECGELRDIDGDGRELEVLPAVAGTVWYELGEGVGADHGLVRHVVATEQLDWGCGAGDINGDGRPDILRPNAWYEAPAKLRSGTWKKHPLAVGSVEEGKADHTPQILVYDVNADGHNDIVTSSAHRYGIFWYEQLPGQPHPRWQQHLIDKSWSQAHNLTLADLDGDGDLDLVTGKRFRAHDGHDPGGTEPLGLYWYELARGPAPKWTRHTISYNQRIGAGMNIPVVDLDGDGDLDIVVTGKWGGPVWFENKSK